MRGVLRRCRWLGPVAVGTACRPVPADPRARRGLPRRPGRRAGRAPTATPAPRARAGGPGARLLGPGRRAAGGAAGHPGRARGRGLGVLASFLRVAGLRCFSFHRGQGLSQGAQRFRGVSAMRRVTRCGTSPWGAGWALGPWGARPPRAARLSLYSPQPHTAGLRRARAVALSLRECRVSFHS